MLWICLFLPHLAVELREPAGDALLAVAGRSGSRRRLLACNAAARACGLAPGIDATVALAREPRLRLLERAPAAELQALKALAGWGEQFSAHVSFDAQRWLLWLEIGASLRYFGGLAPLRARIGAGIGLLGYTAQAGIAATPEAAALFAAEEPCAPALDRASIRAALDPLPLAALKFDEQTLAALRASGLARIGELLDLPRAALARRFGPQLTGYLQRLLGTQADPRSAYRAPRRYRREFEFAAGVTSIEGLLFPLRRLLYEFQGYLRGRDLAVQSLQLLLRHRDAAPTPLPLRTSVPQRDALRLFALLREKLERTHLPEAVLRIELGAHQFVPPGPMQADLFDAPRGDGAGWPDLLDKLRARLGADAVRYLGLADDHRPEQAWCVRDSGAPAALPPAFPDRPLWIFAPQPIERLPPLLGTPERIEAGWWQQQDSSRDYYLARTAQGERWWLYRDAASRQWFLQGLWA